MKALAIDSAVSKLTIAAKNDDKSCTTIFDIGMKQSETLLPAIDYVLSKTGITPAELDYLTLSAGPGSFTGLRLAFSALKAIECAFKIPVYGISSLYIHTYAALNSINKITENDYILSCIDANKDKFYGNLQNNKNEIMPDGDYSFEELRDKITEILESKSANILICGPDKNKFYELLKTDEKLSGKLENIFVMKYEPCATDILFELAEQNIANGIEPLKDFDGPVYLRASEAELVLQNKQNNQ